MNNTTNTEINFDAKILKELAKLASKDDCRADMESVHLDTDSNGIARLWVTDGHCAALYLLGKVDFEVKTQSYDQEAIKKLGMRDTITYCKETETLRDERGPLVLSQVQTRPEIDQVIPRDETTVNPSRFLAVSPKLVSRCFSFLDKVTQDAGIKLIVPKDELSPMIATSQSTTASVVIMPIRL